MGKQFGGKPSTATPADRRLKANKDLPAKSVQPSKTTPSIKTTKTK